MHRGLSQGNQTGMGLRDRDGAGNSIALQEPGMQTEAFEKLSHGKMWNSVLMMVGHMGRSNGKPMQPTLSGGMHGSGGHTLGGAQSAATD